MLWAKATAHFGVLRAGTGCVKAPVPPKIKNHGLKQYHTAYGIPTSQLALRA